MASTEALSLLLKPLLFDINQWMETASTMSIGEAVRMRDNISASFDVVMNHLRKMMLGYENEEVHGIFDDLKSTISSIVGWMGFRSWIGVRKSTLDTILEACEKLCNIRFSSTTEAEETVVGFDDEAAALLDQLTGTSMKQLQIISIAGMAGLGKTTLARKLYRDPLIEYVFDIRAWTCVSQVYLKRDLLLSILSSFTNDLTDEMYKMSDNKLGEKLYRLLKGRQYLVVLDDIWDCKAWNDIRMYFPDDKTGSRVLFTSRDIDLSLHVGESRPAHLLRLRTEDESWDIFQMKVFRTGICPHRLQELGTQIARKCEGLPLAIVITAGLLKNQSSHTWWSQIAESLHSFMVRDPTQYMDSLALSYDHLPAHLRQCFLFVGVFPEDYVIPVTKLTCLWIAQGYICETGCRILEDVAQDMLMDLIKRSLLMVAKTRADGQIKACRIHDLLRDLCLRKAKEENFSPQIYQGAPVLARPIASSRTSVNHPALFTHSSFRCPTELGVVLSETYKSLRILDVESVPIALFPVDVTELVNLRYLAIQARDGSPQPSISKLVNLQMLIISSRKNILVPKTIWSMVNLRHLYIKSGENLMEEPCLVQVTEKDGLASLQTLSQVSPGSCPNMFSCTPNLRKLGFCGPLISELGVVDFPNIGSLQHLQTLKLLNTNPFPEPTIPCNPFMFPKKLKKLTLSNTGMDWEEMWIFSLLPNLEVLKLKFHACIGEKWEMGDVEYQKLKILKLYGLEVRQWVCWRDNFPVLQRLVVHDCLKLESIPSDIGKILTLDVIEVQGCSRSAQVSAQEIQKEQENEGNSFLKVHTANNF